MQASIRGGARFALILSTDGMHRTRRLDEARRVDFVTFPLGVDVAADDVGNVGLGSAAERKLSRTNHLQPQV